MNALLPGVVEGTPAKPLLDSIMVGIDVGSTTVKTVVVDPVTLEILFSDYQYHGTQQAETVEKQLTAIEQRFAHVPRHNIRTVITGSGAGPLREPLGSGFIQEVNAVVMAVDSLHPDAGSIIELGGQDAKIIIYKTDPKTGQRQADSSMNDKCASGTGATIDKCMIKVGVERERAMALRFDDSKLHHVAAKCGVFAETDIVNLIKSGIPSDEVLCSLADAIVSQNLSVLTRGNTLPHKVVLLGGPNTYLKFLQDCWRKRIPEVWALRGYEWPKDVALEDLIFVPKNSDLYAAYGAAVFGLKKGDDEGVYQGLDALRAYIGGGRAARLGDKAGPALVKSDEELQAFVAKYRIPPFKQAEFPRGATVRGYIGLDGGSTSSKAVLIGENGDILFKTYMLSKGNPIEDMQILLANIREYGRKQGIKLEIAGFGATGYAGAVLEQALNADVSIVETVAHMIAAVHFFGDVDVICDVGGQDIKVLFMVNKQIRNFRLSNQCSAGNGMLLQAMASQFGVKVTDYSDHAFAAKLSPVFSYGCAVFLDSDRVTFQKEGFSRDELLAGLAMVLPKNIWQYVVQIPRMAQLGKSFVLQGGTQYNLSVVKAQHDYIAERVPGAEIHVHPHPGEAGALGAALETKRLVERRGHSTFIGLEAAIALGYSTKNDESTICSFCPNHCHRTFIDTVKPDGGTSRYIAGFSCERGTVESQEALGELVRHRKKLKSCYPNLVDYEAKLAFKSFYKPETMPAQGEPFDDIEVKKTLLGKVVRRPVKRTFERSSADAAEKRKAIRVGIPKVLNLYSAAPMFRAYFEAVGITSRNVVFSDFTSEELWNAGNKYGSIDPCYPAKVAQSHIHNLLNDKHKERPLNYIFFPCITHLPTFLEGLPDSTSCPIVAGTPMVMRAAFTKEVDFFKRAGVEYVCPAVTLIEPNYFKQQMWEAWGARLGLTRDESDFACDQGFKAIDQFDAEMERRGLEVLEEIERDNKVALLMLGRPYHNDPGINHDVLEEFQALGYPILSIRSIPKNKEWLERYFTDDGEAGGLSPMMIRDVWPEAYSTNSAQKVWAAKFAARHPNIAVLDLSNFKCGHDAPTYGLIDNVINAAGTPFSALHDIDANKPGGSIKIRVSTYAYTLELRRQQLSDFAAKRGELEKLLAARRAELLAGYKDELVAAIGGDGASAAPEVLDAIYAEFLDSGTGSYFPTPAEAPKVRGTIKFA
jgi:activator of 2-hydroxyglutaryl-CoA dehydratase/predicted nucleotide-binding protein (sugar kinase/HSP70/actin superfamily)